MHKTPSRIAYEQRTKVISFRLSLVDYEHLDMVRQEKGYSSMKELLLSAGAVDHTAAENKLHLGHCKSCGKHIYTLHLDMPNSVKALDELVTSSVKSCEVCKAKSTKSAKVSEREKSKNEGQ